MSTGLKANNDGSAAIQVGGTDYITISSAGAVAIPVSLTVGGVPAGGNYALVSYTSPTTWDATAKKAAGLKAIKVTVVGAGGAGGPAAPLGPATVVRGSGGGGGGAAIEYVPVSNITPGTKTVTAGPGTNSFGPWGTATPNSPTATATATAGSAGTSAAVSTVVLGGGGGTGSGGSLTMNGQQGDDSGVSTGGMSILGVGGRGVPNASAPTTGQSGSNYGGGGAGSLRGGPGTTPGGTGGPGVVIIEEFY